jgi:hypothetical protein
MPVNTFQGFNAQDIIPSDSSPITIGGSSIEGLDNGVVLYVGSGGDIQVTMIGSQVVILVNVPSGTFLPIQVNKVWASNTTASNILAFY